MQLSGGKKWLGLDLRCCSTSAARVRAVLWAERSDVLVGQVAFEKVGSRLCWQKGKAGPVLERKSGTDCKGRERLRVRSARLAGYELSL